MFSRICCFILRSATSGDLFFWKPNCSCTIILFEFKKHTFIYNTFRYTFAKTESTEIGLQLYKSSTGPPLCITATRACLIFSGKTPVASIRLQTCASGVLIVSQMAFRGLGLISSAPDAQSFFKDRIKWLISYWSVGLVPLVPIYCQSIISIRCPALASM